MRSSQGAGGEQQRVQSKEGKEGHGQESTYSSKNCSPHFTDEHIEAKALRCLLICFECPRDRRLTQVICPQTILLAQSRDKGLQDRPLW